jgi:hypothetical protein
VPPSRRPGAIVIRKKSVAIRNEDARAVAVDLARSRRRRRRRLRDFRLEGEDEAQLSLRRNPALARPDSPRTLRWSHSPPCGGATTHLEAEEADAAGGAAATEVRRSSIHDGNMLRAMRWSKTTVVVVVTRWILLYRLSRYSMYSSMSTCLASASAAGPVAGDGEDDRGGNSVGVGGALALCSTAPASLASAGRTSTVRSSSPSRYRNSPPPRWRRIAEDGGGCGPRNAAHDDDDDVDERRNSAPPAAERRDILVALFVLRGERTFDSAFLVFILWLFGLPLWLKAALFYEQIFIERDSF